ncbi:chaperone protein EcpD [Escherichia coli]|uniref:Chaperone protein EcpD n=1 Tax=Escherichia coli TaxID=562 RepID=A0A377KC41_ECOLX|nr:chaperone protein EcpD [Escherichia coli]
MFFNTKHTAALCLASCMAFSSSAIADIVISGTRVVYKSEQKTSMYVWKIKAITHCWFRVG